MRPQVPTATRLVGKRSPGLSVDAIGEGASGDGELSDGPVDTHHPPGHQVRLQPMRGRILQGGRLRSPPR